MAYKHKYFQLDDKSKKVFDENGRKLHLTGNSYRMLVFLCEKKNANLTEIGDCLDWAKDYDENHLRQYRYKINTIIGRDIIEYKNNIYSIKGEIEKCNTDLLQGNSVELKTESKKSFMDKIRELKFVKLPAIVASILLLLTFFDWPYGYYNFLRIAITIIAVLTYFIFRLS